MWYDHFDNQMPHCMESILNMHWSNIQNYRQIDLDYNRV